VAVLTGAGNAASGTDADLTEIADGRAATLQMEDKKASLVLCTQIEKRFRSRRLMDHR
jgi:hypothetical protein